MAGPNDTLPGDAFATAGIEDKLQDLRTLVSFGLWKIESADADEFARAQNQFCTLFYLLTEKLDGISREIDPKTRAEYIHNMMRPH